MTILLCKAGKRYNREWIFKNLDYRFVEGERYAITGANGSGKSTLLQAVAGAITISAGSLEWYKTGHKQPLDADSVCHSISMAAPYMELTEEMTLQEFLLFHTRFKPFYPDISHLQAAAAVGLSAAMNKPIMQFSSGMKQRLRLAQAFFSAGTALFLDEPVSNLDKQGIELYIRLVEQYTRNRLLIISSNDPAEYATCRHILRVEDYKN